LLASVEEATALPCGRGWLDLQRYAVSACEHLGEEYAPVAMAIRGLLRDSLLTFPQLPHVTLMDDTPAPNAETQQWIREQVSPGSGLRQILSAAPAADNASGAIYEQALEAVQGGVMAMRWRCSLAMLRRTPAGLVSCTNCSSARC
jgi:type VI secretion system protein ImpA